MTDNTTLLAHRIFERQAAKTPTAACLELGGKQLSYDEVDRRADHLAHRLVALGVRPDSVVGLYADRSFEMIIGYLGILKAGGTVLPLDSAYPAARLQFMLQDSGALGIVGTATSRQLEFEPKPQIIEIDLAQAAPRGPRVDANVSPENLAYIIYTSGSTGTPKGVMVRHGGLTNLIHALGFYEHDTRSRVLQFASLSFDTSVWEVMMTIMYGATLVLAPRSELRPGAELVQTLRDARISMVTLPPSVLALLPPDEFPALAKVCSAGEALSTELRAAWTKEGHIVSNSYGPTEVTVCATIDDDILRDGKITIGKLIPNCKIHLLDDQLRPVKPGDIGEIYIGGVGMARGYLKRPGLTAERFLCDPFSDRPGARMYKTGDLARALPDGSIVFVGRADFQVKIRGFRIEIGEIECALRESPLVRDCAVVVREINGLKTLVGFVKPVTPGAATPEKLTEFLTSRLPPQMLPTFALIDEFPLTHNRKIDREALQTLPLPERVDGEAARTELERLLVEIWGKTLGTDASDVSANFFEIGGDSLRAAMVMNALGDRLEETVYVVALFDHPTISELAEYLQAKYAPAVARLLGGAANTAAEAKLTAQDVSRMREAITSYMRPKPSPRPGGKNPRAVFVLSPPRSGSTMFRVMLAGHPQLYVPQELNLLGFDRLGTQEMLAHGFTWSPDGTIRALMQIKSWTVEQAKAFVADCEAKQLSTKEMTRTLQDLVSPRLLVDKSTIYAFDRNVLERAEQDFEGAFYIHLLRHPCGMIRSFENVRLDQLIRWSEGFSPKRMGELSWMICVENTLAFLKHVPAERQYTLRYEDVVANPRGQMVELCARLGIPFHEGMVEPYKDMKEKMVDGIYADAASRQVGDVNFHKHGAIKADLASAWKQELSEEQLGTVTRELAKSLGY